MRDIDVDMDCVRAKLVSIYSSSVDITKLFVMPLREDETFEQAVDYFLAHLKKNYTRECFDFVFTWVDRRWLMIVDLRKADYYETLLTDLQP